MQQYGEPPNVILLANHGVITLGQTPQEALNIMDMCVKSADILWGVLAIGAPVFMSEAEIMHINGRPDEIYRRQLFVGDRKNYE
jgi:ribulose-5-phosphate 4-epimerase/fuculose-1-phosphate aldolase